MNKMPKKKDKFEIAKRINNAGQQYKNDLVGKTFLILYEGHSIEVLFKTENFLHLCGVDTLLYAKEFYRKAVKGQIKPSEIGFSDIHPYVFADIKTRHLSEAFSLLKRDSLVITNISTQSRSYELGTTDFELVLCFDAQLNDNGVKTSDILIPYSLRVEEIANNRYKEIYEVDYVLSKPSDEKTYTNVEFGDSALLHQYMVENAITKYSVNVAPNKLNNPRNLGDTGLACDNIEKTEIDDYDDIDR